MRVNKGGPAITARERRQREIRKADENWLVTYASKNGLNCVTYNSGRTISNVKTLFQHEFSGQGVRFVSASRFRVT